jgi:hypothetical protein
MDDEQLPPSLTVSFLHAVGQSTLRQGLAVPRMAQLSWLAAIEKGQKVPVTIQFADGQSVSAQLRRINNARGHLQFRYESKQQAPLRDYLSRVFGDKLTCPNAVLRVTEVQARTFVFEPVSDGGERPASLSLCRPHFHRCMPEAVERMREFTELRRGLNRVRYDENYSQAEYNGRIATALDDLGWRKEVRILDEIGLRCDFEKNGIWAEVEFGNARVYYQDYIKFLLAMRHRDARLGILLCPTNAFAQLVCDLGQRRAAARQAGGAGRRPSYSGMMSYEKAVRELPFLEFLLSGSLVIAGIEIEGSRPAIRHPPGKGRPAPPA